jgi:ClpP class serine protease
MSSTNTRARRTNALPFDADDIAMQVEQFAASGPFAMRQARFAALQGGALAQAGVASQAYTAKEYGRVASVRQGIVTIPVFGLLVPRENWMTEYFDATAYESILQDATRAMRDPAVRGLLLSFDSGGGALTGASETANQLLGMRGHKPVRAHVRGDCCGSAYWLAAACDEITVDQTALLGDLGVQLLYYDDRAALEADGVAEIIITSSQTPEKNRRPIDTEGAAQWQQLADDLAGVMLTSVAAARGLAIDALTRSGGNGALLIASKAVASGLADGVSDVDAVHRALVSSPSVSNAKANTSTIAARQAAEASQAGTEQILAVMRLINPNALVSKRR